MHRIDRTGSDLAAASIEATSGVPFHKTVCGCNVVLISEEHFRSLAAPARRGSTRQRLCRPVTIAELTEIIGVEQAHRLADARRHIPRVALPAVVSDDHWLVRLIGRPATDLLCAAFAASGTESVTLVLPVVSSPGRFYAEARQKAASMSVSGLSARVIAQTLGVSPRAVVKWRAKARADGATRSAGRHRRSSPLHSKRVQGDV